MAPQRPTSQGGAAAHVITPAAGVMARAPVASIFSRDEIAGPAKVKANKHGDVAITAGTTKVHFKLNHGQLELDQAVC